MKQTKILCGQLNCSVKLADVSTRCSSRPQGKSEVRCKKLVLLYRRGYCACAPMRLGGMYKIFHEFDGCIASNRPCIFSHFSKINL